MLLEVFGHVFISIATSFGYLIYYLQPNFCMYGIMISQWSDFGGLMFGSNFGKTPFASSISPSKTFEGVYGAIGWPCTVITAAFYFIGKYSEGKYAI
jgi:CDP-diglyceride synthetase